MEDDLNGDMTPEAGERMDAEFQYVIGHVTQRDVVVDGEIVVPAGVEVTAAEATAALAVDALEDLAFAVGAGDRSSTEAHSMPE
jgi:hypothetical protein